MEKTLEYALAQLKANKLSELDLSYKNLTEAQVIRLAEVLKHNHSLTMLYLGGNQLGAAGAESLSEALKVNQTLTTLDLNSNYLGAVGAEKICEALKVNQTLATLDLRNNQLGAMEIEKICEALKVNRALTTLDLRVNMLFAATAEKICETLKVNQNLTYLNLSYNQLDNVTVQRIQEALQTNRDQIKSTRNQTLLTLVILLRHAHSPVATLPFELWKIIMQQLDFPSVSKGYRTSHALVSFLTQKNILTEFNQRLQTQQSIRLLETHAKVGELRFIFLTPFKRKRTSESDTQLADPSVLKKAKYN